MFGNNLKKARENKGYTQEQLSELLGINRVNLAYYENGTKIPSLAVTAKIADILECSIDWLIGRNGD